MQTENVRININIEILLDIGGADEKPRANLGYWSSLSLQGPLSPLLNILRIITAGDVDLDADADINVDVGVDVDVDADADVDVDVDAGTLALLFAPHSLVAITSIISQRHHQIKGNIKFTLKQI